MSLTVEHTFQRHLSLQSRVSFATQTTFKYIYYLFSLSSLYHLFSIAEAWLNCIDFSSLLFLCLLMPILINKNFESLTFFYF